MRTRYIQNGIINILSDNRLHTLRAISEKLEVSSKTIYNHIKDLSVDYPITSFKGGQRKGGHVLLDDFTAAGIPDDELNDIIAILENYPKNSTTISIIKKLKKISLQRGKYENF